MTPTPLTMDDQETPNCTAMKAPDEMPFMSAFVSAQWQGGALSHRRYDAERGDDQGQADQTGRCSNLTHRIYPRTSALRRTQRWIAACSGSVIDLTPAVKSRVVGLLGADHAEAKPHVVGNPSVGLVH
jgi:hypothetical protein